MSSISNLILDSLDELGQDDFDRFKSCLRTNLPEGFDPIPRSKLEKAKQLDVLEMMVDQYTEPDAGKITVHILKKVRQNKLASNLEKELEGLGCKAQEDEAVTVPAAKQSKGAEFVDKHRDKLIQRIPAVMEIADRLLSKNMITDENYSTLSTIMRPQERMRELYSFLNLGGKAVKEEFYQILKEKNPYLVSDLEG